MGINAKVIAIGVCILVLAGSYAGPRQGKQRSFKDKAGNMSLTGWADFIFSPTDRHISATATAGGKLHAIWSKQHIEIFGGSLDANLGGTMQEGYQLKNATIKGGVEASIVRTASVGQQLTNVAGETATYTAVENRLHVTGSVHVHSKSTGTGEIMDATGSSADLYLTPAGEAGQPLRRANLAGPVKIDWSGTRIDNSGGNPKRVPFGSHGTGDRLEFDDTARTIVLSGHVHLDTDDPGIGADIDSDVATLHLNPDNSVNYLELGQTGTTQGRTVLIDKRGGGNSR